MSPLSRVTAASFCWWITQADGSLVFNSVVERHWGQDLNAVVCDPRGLLKTKSACVRLTLVLISFVRFSHCLIHSCSAAFFFQIPSLWPVILCSYNTGWFYLNYVVSQRAEYRLWVSWIWGAAVWAVVRNSLDPDGWEQKIRNGSQDLQTESWPLKA